MIKYKRLDDSSAFKYELTDTCTVWTDIEDQSIDTANLWLDLSGLLAICRGFRWDGATFCPDWMTGILPPLVHDALYGLMLKGLLSSKYRKQIDRLFRQMIREDISNDTNIARKLLRMACTPIIYSAVRLFGARHCKAEQVKGDKESVQDVWIQWTNVLNDAHAHK